MYPVGPSMQLIGLCFNWFLVVGVNYFIRANR